MDFSSVVRRTRHLLAGRSSPSKDEPDGMSGEEVLELKEEVYGRVCTTAAGSADPPVRLSSDAERKSVFLFGPDAVKSILLQQSAADILCSIGRDRDYLHYTVG